MKTREDAFNLLNTWVTSKSLKNHCLGVAVCMEEYAEKYLEDKIIDNNRDLVDNGLEGEEGEREGNKSNAIINNKFDDGTDIIKNNLKNEIIDKYWITGLLHDFDWEKFPDIDKHPIEGCKELRRLEYGEDVIVAILGHNSKTGIKRQTLMAKTLFAVDELSGLVVALAKVRPGNFDGMSVKSVKKAIKKKDFAAAVSRKDILLGMEELGLVSDEDKNRHFELIIRALSKIKGELGFDN